MMCLAVMICWIDILMAPTWNFFQPIEPAFTDLLLATGFIEFDHDVRLSRFEVSRGSLNARCPFSPIPTIAKSIGASLILAAASAQTCLGSRVPSKK